MRRAYVTIAVAAVLLAGVAFHVGCGPTLWNARDSAVHLDAGWRVCQGQVQHADFHSGLGPVIGWFNGLGLAWTGNINGLFFANTVFALIVAALAAWITRGRLSAFWSATFAISLLALLLTHRRLDGPFDLPAFPLIHNRWGEALLALVLVDLFLRAGHWTNGIVTGAALALMLFTKLNYFGIAVLGVGLRQAAGPRDRRWIVACASAAGLVVAGGALALGGLGGFWRDMREISGTQDWAWRFRTLRHEIKDARYPLFVAIGFWFAVLPLLAERRRWAARFWLMNGGFLLIGATNSTNGAIPLVGCAAMLAVAAARTEPVRRYLVASGLAVAAVAMVAVPNLASLAYSATWGDGEGVIDAPALRGMLLHREPLTSNERILDVITSRPPDKLPDRRLPGEYGQMVNDGLALLRRRVRPTDRIGTADLADFFSCPLGLPSPRGAPLWWDASRSFSRERHPPAAQAFGDATLLMIPKWAVATRAAKLLREVYGEYWKAEFHPVAESRLWTLHERIDR
jgi:hypothetical protein